MRMQLEVEGSGTPLVLMGGGLTGWLSWEPHARRLAGARRVARPQLLAVQLGLEGRPLPEGYSVEMESAALAAALDGQNLGGPLDLVAWSFGGLVTLDFALDRAERVRTLTLIEPNAFWVLEATATLDDHSRRERDELKALHDEMKGDVTEDQLARFVRLVGLCPPGRTPEDLPSWALWSRHRRSLLSGPAVFRHDDDAARLRALERPVLLVKGSGSSHSLHRIVEALSAELPRARTVEFPGGHAPHLVSMDVFLAELVAFQETLS
jgi:pimeloyl-ACP methyl ester carboxylesterase